MLDLASPDDEDAVEWQEVQIKTGGSRAKTMGKLALEQANYAHETFGMSRNALDEITKKLLFTLREGGCSHVADQLLHMLLRPRLAAAAGTLHECVVTAAVFEDRVRAVRDILGEGPRGGHDTEEQTCVDDSAPQGMVQ